MMNKTIQQVLYEYGFYNIFDVLDFIDDRINKADENNVEHYRFVKAAIEERMFDIIKRSEATKQNPENVDCPIENYIIC